MIWGCENIDVCGTRIASPAFVPAQRYKGSLVIRRPGLFFSIGGGKNGLRSLRLYQAIMVRSQTAPSARLRVWRSSHLRGDRGATYRIVVSDLWRRRPIWFGGQDRSEQSMDEFFQWLGPKKSKQIRLAVMDMWKAFRKSTLKLEHASQAAILFDKFHVLRHLGEALDRVRKSEYGRLTGKDRRFVKGQKYTLLSHRENLTHEGRRSLRMLLKANKRLNTAYVLKEVFGQLWEYQTEGWARRFFENWRDSLKWQRLKPYEKFAEMIESHWDGIAAYCNPENKVALGFVEGLNNKIRVIQRRSYGLRDEEYLRLKILTCMLEQI